MIFLVVIFIIGAIAGFSLPRREKETQGDADMSAQHSNALPDADREPMPENAEESFYIDHTGRKFRLMEQCRAIPRRTYLRGNISGKYRGTINLKDDESAHAAFYDFNIYEAEVRNVELSTQPYPPKAGDAFPRDRFPVQLPITLKDRNREYQINIHEPVLGSVKLIRKLHQTDGDEVYGTLEGRVSGYILDQIQEQYLEKEYFETKERPTQKAIAGTAEVYQTDMPTGNVAYQDDYVIKEYFYSDYEQKYWGKPSYRGSALGSGETFLSIVLWVFLGSIFFIALVLLLPKLRMIVPFLMIPLLSSIVPKRLFNWVLRGVSVLLIAGFLLALFHQSRRAGRDVVRKPLVQDTPLETKRTYEPIRDTVDNRVVPDTLITHFRSWSDYAGHTYEGWFWVKNNDKRSAHLFKEHLPIPQNTEDSYDRIIYSLKNHDTAKLGGLYVLFDSLRATNDLNGMAFSEMIVSFVQDIPYTIVLPESCDASQYSDQFIRSYLADGNARCEGFQKFGINTPVEFLASLQGDCDTRTLLLYTVLSHYGFDVALLSSEYYNHSLLGINLPYEGSSFNYGAQRYVLWETTAPGMAPGIVSEKIANTHYWRISLKSK